MTTETIKSNAILINDPTTGAELATIETVSREANIATVTVSADRRSTKQNPVPEDQRIRRVLLPASIWGNYKALIGDDFSQALTDCLRKGINDLADARLKEYLQENPMHRTVRTSDYSIPALLAWSESTAASRGSLTFTKEEVIEWFPTSKIAARLKKASQAHYDKGLKRLSALAAKNHGLEMPADALGLIALLEQDASAEDAPALVSEMVSRLGNIAKTLAERKKDDVDLNDLANV